MDITFFFFLTFFYGKLLTTHSWRDIQIKPVPIKPISKNPHFENEARDHTFYLKHRLGTTQEWPFYTTSLPYVNATIFTTVYNIFILGASFEGNQCVSSSTQALACSRRSYSGERCKVKKEMKSRGELSPSLVFIFLRSFLLDTAPHYLTTWNRLPRHSLTTFLWCTRVCEVSKWYSLKGKNLLRGGKFWTAAQPVPRNPEMPSTEQG